MIYHNSQDIDCRSPFGAVPVSSKVKLNINAENASGVVLRTWTNEFGEQKYEMQKIGSDEYFVEITVPDFGTLLWYYFIIYYPNGDSVLYGDAQDHLGGIGREYDNEPESFQITVYKASESPEWFKNSIMYQIFPDRFCRGSDFDERAELSGKHILSYWEETPRYIKNDAGEVIDWTFHGGTLKGIEEHLDYLESLGIGTIYMNPVFKARSNHRYDTSDYMQIDPLLGDDQSFVSLCKKADEHGIKIIFDGVFSHTGQDSIYFAEGSPYRSWYTFHEDGSYDCWWGVKDLPEVDETNPSYNEYICGPEGVINKWISLGASGIRLDVADELPDSFIRNIRSRLKETKKDSVLLGEVWEDASNKFSHGEMRKYLMGDELDSVMNYPLRSMLIDFALGKADSFKTVRSFMSLYENYPKDELYSAMNLLGSHDRERIMTTLDSDEERVKMLYALLFFMPGVPCIYYGDETGLEGSTDPENRRPYPWGRENNGMIYFFRDLAKDYHSHSAMKNGSFEPVYLNSDVLSFIRENGEEKILVLSNRTEEDLTVNYKGEEYEIPAIRTIFRNI